MNHYLTTKEPLPYPLVTNNLPAKLVSLESSSREELFTEMYSVVKPVSVTFFKLNISPCYKSTYIHNTHCIKTSRYLT